LSKFYNPQRTRNLYLPQSGDLFKISRSKIDLFLNCPKCFYLDRRLGINQPPSFPFSLNAAVDLLLKKEFDTYRAQRKTHPLMTKAGIKAIPYDHPQVDVWRDSLRGGITYQYPGTDFLITGGVDDVWINEHEELIIVDYKATAKLDGVSIDADWQIGYKRQMEIYQWLFSKNNFKVAETGYFLYCNGLTDREAFNQRLDFDVTIIPYKGSRTWIDRVIQDIHATLSSNNIPKQGPDCVYCQYRETVEKTGTH
jgi:CRISPR/Cas system-associated exonuclease Cas4 (RecB family)